MASRRDLAADERDDSAGQRDEAADRRDRAGDRRDIVANERDIEADQRDEIAERRDPRRQGPRSLRANGLPMQPPSGRKRRTTGSTPPGTAKPGQASGTRQFLRGTGFLQLDREIARAKREDNPLVLGFIDVDRLKATNDEHGHAAVTAC